MQSSRTFQNLLTRIPDWKEETLSKEVERIVISSKCDYLEDLLLGVFVSYIRAFATLQQSDQLRVDIQFTPPSIQVFVHTLYKHAARHAWSNAYLFKTLGVSSEQQARNRRDIETSISNCLNDVIDSFIPWKRVSQAYFRPAPVEAPAPPAPAATTLALPVCSASVRCSTSLHVPWLFSCAVSLPPCVLVRSHSSSCAYHARSACASAAGQPALPSFSSIEMVGATSGFTCRTMPS
jgi:hypothetical protein